MTAVQGSPDPWVIQPRERARYEDQFQSLRPVNGVVTGDQAKGFFLQSQLPLPILGQIWSLADTDSDGKMNIDEFSIACKLINLKLRNFELPKTLPPSLLKMPVASNGIGGPTLIQSPPQIPSNVPQVPLVPAAMPTVTPVPAAPMRPAIPPMSQPMHPLVGGIAPIPPSAAPLIPPTSATIPMVPGSGIAGVMPVAATVPNVLPPTVPNTILPITSNGTSQAAPPPRPPPVGNLPAAPSLERIGSLESPHSVGSPVIEWAVPHQTKLKYTQVFNTTDRSRSGYLSGPQARNIMVQSALPQAILAQIWALADMDSDGRLSCEEFVLALHLCDMAKSGEKIPTQLPIELIPPTFRRQRQGSVPGAAVVATVGSTTSSVGIPSSGSIELMDKDVASSLITATFEDKRKENFEKGQAELERRRKALLEIQRKEQEERERKEKEEQEKRERIRQEQERRRQAELEKQLQRQRELEQEREEQRRRAQEQREAARREMERQRQLEWEKQRSQELQQQRQREQEKVLKLKAQNQNLTIELSQLNDKVKELSQKISETRIGVSGVKTTIDGMRTTRDTQMSEMTALKAKLKEQNQRLLALSQEKARLEAKNKANAGGTDAASQEQAKIAFSNKQITLKQLRDRIEDLQKEISVKLEDIENNNTQLSDLRTQLSSLIQECEKLYTIYEQKKEKILEIKGVSKTRDSTNFSSSWGDSAWGGPPAATTGGWGEPEAPISNWPAEESAPVATSENANFVKYRAIYEFVARNNDELSFQPGDIIMVPLTQNAEPGWLAGELRGHTGWFPETYVELADSPTLNENIEVPNNTATTNGIVFPPDIIMSDKRQLEGIAEVPENLSDNGSFPEGEMGPPVSDELSSPIFGQGQSINIQAQALYSWRARKSSQISFNRNDTILVSEQQDQWCFGEINNTKGWFPKSYVKNLETDSQPKEYYEAIYPYESGEIGDLTFQQGEIVLVIKKEGDWWTGVIEDRQGIFPSNYVQPAQIEPEITKTTDALQETLTAAETHRQQLSSTQPVVIEPAVEAEVAAVSQAQPPVTKERTPSTPDALGQGQEEELVEENEDTILPKRQTPDFLRSPKGKGKKPEVATVIAPYQATSEEQLSLQRGQLVMVRQKSSTGWWEGELQTKGKKRQIGWFPASYVKVIGGQSGSARSTPISHKHQEELQQKQQQPVSPSPITKDEPALEKVRALYSYQALNDDELSFEKGDVITLLVKEEEAWWRGDLNGVSGLFPKNYVEIISSIQLSPMEKKRQDYIMELITTEQSYIDDMSIVHEVFEKPLIQSNVLTPEEIERIFVNWKDIIVCNYTFLRALRIRRDNSEMGCIRMIGDILCENLPRMSAYVRFCSCQLRAATFLQQLHETSPQFHALVKQCQVDPRTQGLPLSSFLIKPMQRITKYPLLIKKILENTPDDHPDFQNIQEALYKAEEFCFQVNEGVREKENSERLEWLQRHVNSEGLEERLVFNSLTNSLGPRKLLHYGLLNKAKSGKELAGFLFNDFFLLVQPNKSIHHNHLFSIDPTLNISFKIYKKPMFLSEWCVDMVGPSPPPGSIVPPSEATDSPRLLRMLHLANKTYLSLLAPTAKDRITWLKHLDQTRRECLELEKSHQQLVQTKKAQFGACGRILVGVTEGIGLRSASARYPADPIGGLLLSLIRGYSLTPRKLSGKCDAFCEVSMGSQEHRTKVYPGSCDPKWNSSMQFLVKDVREDVLCITVFDQGYFSPNEFLGRTEVRVCDILRDTQTTPGPIIKKLSLHECERGEIIIKLDLRLFGNAFEMMQMQR